MTERTIMMTAKDLAGAYYENNRNSEDKAFSERFYKFWPNVGNFIQRNWPTFVPMAKEILMAQMQDPNTPQAIRDAIYDAIVEENTTNANVKGVSVGRGVLNLNPDHPGAMERKVFYDGK